MELNFLAYQVFAHPGNITTFGQQICYINTLTDVGSGGLIGPMMLFLIAGVLFLMIKSHSMDKAFPVSMLITSILGIMLAAIGSYMECGLISSNVLTVCIILAVLGVLMLLKESAQYET
jgi:hypothetical protein